VIIKHPDKHLTDKEFYTLIKFFDQVIEKKGFEDEETFSLSHFSLGSEENGNIFNQLFMSAQVLEVSVDIEKGYKFDEQIEGAKVEAKEKPEKEQKELLKIIRKIQSGKKVKIEEVAKVSWIWYEVYDHIRFTPSEYEIPKEIEKIFRTEIDKYLDNLLNDKLSISRKNYYKFETQKRVLIKLIEDDKKIGLYGNNFIIKEKIDWDGVITKIPDFCLIQTVYALQKLDYLKVLDVWESREYPKDSFDRNSFDYNKEPSRYINVNLVLEDIFVEEINNQYKKENPKNTFEKFDAKRGVLKFAGQEIELSKKGKETDAVLLLKTLLKENTNEWKHNDEILADWGYNDEDQKSVPKNKVYFAGQKVNTAVALKTQIDDFLECNTTKARINPKYRKVDE
jgi:hypothetical protein